jgi:hypothetical protein
MSYDEKRTWIMGVVSACAYAVYAVIILRRADGTPLADVPYGATMLWTIGASIVVSIVLNIAVSVTAPKDAGRQDQRDRQIHRFGDYIGHSFVIAGATAALLLALVKADYFWIANAIYLGFALSAILGSVAKIAAYRRGLPSW